MVLDCQQIADKEHHPIYSTIKGGGSSKRIEDREISLYNGETDGDPMVLDCQ